MSNFTPRAQQVLALARKEADRLNHNFLGTEHLLLGLIKLGQGVAVNVLAKLGLDLETVRMEVEKQIGTGPDQKMVGNIPYTPRVKKVIELAQAEAKQLNHVYVGTEHLLLGLLQEGDGVAAKVLRALDVDVDQTRQEILRELDPNFSASRLSKPATAKPDDQEEARRPDRFTTPDPKTFAENSGNFTPHAQQVLALARMEASRLNHFFIGTEHILLGMIKLGQGTAVNVLTKMGINLESVRLDLEKQVGTGPGEKITGDGSYTPRVIKVIALAQKEAKQFHHQYVGTEHILLGLLREGDGVAAKVLRALNVDIEQTRQDILRELDPNLSAEKSGGQGPLELDNLTPRGKLVFKDAREEASRLNHDFIGIEHLLIGLMKLDQGVAVNILLKWGLNLETVRAVVEKHLPKEPLVKKTESLVYTPAVKEAVSRAHRERQRLNHTYLGTEHLLLGILATKDDTLTKMWADFGIDLEQLRQEILRAQHWHFSSSRSEEEQVTSDKDQTGRGIPEDPRIRWPKPDSVNLSRRYDVYCIQHGQSLVYRNVLFKGAKGLFSESGWDMTSHFVELELPDGKAVFVPKYHIFKFCDPGASADGEEVRPSKP